MNDEFVKAINKILREYGKEYEAIAEQLITSVLGYLQDGYTITQAYHMAREKIDFYNLNAEAVEDAVYEAALKGYGVNAPPVFTSVEGGEKLRHKLMDVAWSADAMKLSTRLHGVDNVLRNNVKTTVRNALNTYKTIQQISIELYDGYNQPDNVLKQAELPKYLKRVEKLTTKLYSGDKNAAKNSAIHKAVKKDVKKIKTKALQAAYNQVLEASTTDKKRALQKAKKMLEMGKSKKEVMEMLLNERDEALKKALWVAIQEKTRYHAERIARTEAARAYYESQMAKAANDEDVFGFKWVLSTAHGHTIDCDCEMYSQLDIGYGKGIFPKDQTPFLPAHPNCMCHLRIVYTWEVKQTGGHDTMPPQPENKNRIKEVIDELTP